MALHGTVKYSDMREVLVSLSWKYVVLSVLGAMLVPFICAWFWTYNFDVKFSCEKSKNLCQIERVNFANQKVVRQIINYTITGQESWKFAAKNTNHISCYLAIYDITGFPLNLSCQSIIKSVLYL